MKYHLLLLFLSWDLRQTSSKVFTRCGLTEALLQQGFPKSFVGNCTYSRAEMPQTYLGILGVCLIESESARNTTAVTNRANGGKGLGLFQINSKQWCKYGKAGGSCNVKCEDLINDNIADDSTCAKKIQEEKGFQYWSGWKRNCYGRNRPLPRC